MTLELHQKEPGYGYTQFPLHDLYLRVDRRHFDIVTLAETLNIQLPNRCKRSVKNRIMEANPIPRY